MAFDSNKVFYYFDPNYVKLPQCPHNVKEIRYPSIAFVFSFISVASLFFAVYTALRYNFVIAWRRKVRKENISNTFWIFYFVSIFFRSGLQSVQYSFEMKNFELIWILLSLVLYGVSVFILSLALNHQKEFRSKDGNEHTESLQLQITPKSEWLKNTFLSPEILFFVILLIYLAFIFVISIIKIDDSTANILIIIFMIIYGLQRVPIIILLIMILFLGSSKGPSTVSKVFLTIAVFLNLCNDFPITLWSLLDSNIGCNIFDLISWLDLVHFCYFFAILFFFIFLIEEFRRNKEDAIWTIIKQQQVCLFYYLKL